MNLHPSASSAPRPLRRALTLTGATAALTIASALLLEQLVPGLEPIQQRFITVLVLALVAVFVTTVTHKDLLTSGGLLPRLILVPAAIALAPFAAGLKEQGPATAAVLIIGYLATGIYEELWFRGLVLNALETWTSLRAALLSSALFGLAHLSNLAFGANPTITAAQVIGAACFGVGLAALRLRGVALWPLILIHALTDIALQLGDLTTGVRWVFMIGGDTALLIFGILILRKDPIQTQPPREAVTKSSSL